MSTLIYIADLGLLWSKGVLSGLGQNQAVAGYLPVLKLLLFGLCSDSLRECCGVPGGNPNNFRTTSAANPAQTWNKTEDIASCLT